MEKKMGKQCKSPSLLEEVFFFFCDSGKYVAHCANYVTFGGCTTVIPKHLEHILRK